MAVALTWRRFASKAIASSSSKSRVVFPYLLLDEALGHQQCGTEFGWPRLPDNQLLQKHSHHVDEVIWRSNEQMRLQFFLDVQEEKVQLLLEVD